MTALFTNSSAIERYVVHLPDKYGERERENIDRNATGSATTKDSRNSVLELIISLLL